MDIAEAWPRLTAATREWLVEHNGEALSPVVAAEVLAVAGGVRPSWVVDSADGPGLTDDAVDWIEAVANGE